MPLSANYPAAVTAFGKTGYHEFADKIRGFTQSAVTNSSTSVDVDATTAAKLDAAGITGNFILHLSNVEQIFIASRVGQTCTFASGGRAFGSPATTQQNHASGALYEIVAGATQMARVVAELQAIIAEVGVTGSQNFLRLDGSNVPSSPLRLPSYTKAGLPAAGTVGRVARVSDNVRGLWMDSGTQWFSLNHEQIDPRDFGATGDGVTDDSAPNSNAIDAAIASGKTVVYPSGYTFLVDTKSITAAIGIRVEAGATLKLKNNATEVGSSKALFIISASDVTIDCLGWLDANRDGQNQATYNAAGGSNAKSWHGVIVSGSSGSRRTNLRLRLRIKNSPDIAFSAGYMEDSLLDLQTETCGGGSDLSHCARIFYPSAQIHNTDNAAWRIYPHIFDLAFCSQISIGTIISVGQTGNDSTGTSTTLSDWLSGVTFHGVSDVVIDSVYLDTVNDAAGNKSVGISLLGCERMSIDKTEVVGYSDVALELGGIKDSSFGEIILDGRYQLNNLGTSASYKGFAIYHNGYYSDFVSRSVSTSERLHIGSMVIRRFLGNGGIINSVKDLTIDDLRVYGCRLGLLLQYSEIDTSSNWTPQPVQSLKRITFQFADLSYNEIRGLDVRDAEDLIIGVLRSNNNGQALNYPTGTRLDGTTSFTSHGIFTSSGTGSLTKTGWSLGQVETVDDQTWTQSVSAKSSTPTTISASDPSRFHIGQTIKLTGAGVAGADLFVRINDRDRDEITISDAITTFPTVAGTGTVGVSGTTLTGVGTVFFTELLGRYWITVSGQTFQIAKVASNTSATVTAAASPTIAPGASFTITKITANAVQSQQTGILLHSSVISPNFTKYRATGNTTANLNDGTASATPFAHYAPPIRIEFTSDLADGFSLVGKYATNQQTPRLIFWNSVEGGSTGFAFYKSGTNLRLTYGASPTAGSGSTVITFAMDGGMGLSGGLSATTLTATTGNVSITLGSLSIGGTALFDNSRQFTVSLIPAGNGTLDVGSSGSVLRFVYSQSFTIKNLGAGTNPSFSSNSGIQTIDVNAVLLRPSTDNNANLGNAQNRWITVYGTSFNVILASNDSNAVLQMSSAGLQAGSGGSSSVDVTFSRQAAGEYGVSANLTITGTVADGVAGTLRLAPTYTAATAQTVTRHNYLEMPTPVLSGAGPAAVTDAAIIRFNAAAGTHKAVDAATTKTTPGGVDAWVKINVNGTILYMPAYVSKTA